MPSSLRGELTKWMLELKAGIFIGTLSALVREKLWNHVCDKISDGGAFLIHPMNNEQKFEILTHGNTQRIVIDVDGISLIRIPLIKRQSNTKIHEKRLRKNELTDDDVHVALPSTEPKDLLSISPGFLYQAREEFPKNFIWRSLQIIGRNNQIQFNYQGMSSYPEVQYDDIWQDVSKLDLETVCTCIMKVIQDPKIIENKIYFNKRIISLDIETTDYLPKAYEGFVNILGIAIVDFAGNSANSSSLTIHQIFNMTRKKEYASNLIWLLREEIERADVCVLFNKNFDLKILENIIKDENLIITFPTMIIDLNEKFNSLFDLEQSLAQRTGFHRQQTQKSQFLNYYKLFKGIGREGKNRKLEPLGSYNLLDTLTPLLFHLLDH